MILFGKEIKLRTHYCQFFDFKPSKIEEPYINLYIRFKGCNANCQFCTYMDSAKKFNYEKFNEILTELKNKIYVRKVGFTGGEPTLNYELFSKVLKETYNILGKKTEFSVNSNGVNFKKLYQDKELMNIINHLHLSRHHYDDIKNNEILEFSTLKTEEIKELQNNINNPDFLQLSCNLIKGYIDNDDEIKKYLEFSNSVGVYRVGLVSLMPINDYSKQNFIDNNFKIFNTLYQTQKWTNEGYCSCSNYIYVPDDLKNHCVKLYKKNTYNISNINNTLTFNGENLVYGYDDNNIIY